MSDNDLRNSKNSNEDLAAEKISKLRRRLLDTSGRNPLVSTRFSGRALSFIRIVNTIPTIARETLRNTKIQILSLPSLDDDPSDENCTTFQNELSEAKLIDEEYLTKTSEIDQDSENYSELERKYERELKDRIRIKLNMPTRQTDGEISLNDHAKINHILPRFDLAENIDEIEDLDDSTIQTMFLPQEFDKRVKKLISKCKSWEDETGVNVLHLAFGFLEWREGKNVSATKLSPLLLLEVEIEKVATESGVKYYVSSRENNLESNLVLLEKMKKEFNYILPEFDDDNESIEDYLGAISASLKQFKSEWRVRNQLVLGVFPSSSMAMYNDLDEKNWDLGEGSLVASMLGGDSPSSESPFVDDSYDEIDELDTDAPNLLCDADSSQFKVIKSVIQGKNMAVEGPPGSGKSQTIVNTIAAAISTGKKVLFVAEKSAALEVVKARLDANGLGSFVLPILSSKKSKDRVYENIQARLRVPLKNREKEFLDKKQLLLDRRDQISRYVSALSKINPYLRLSNAEIIGRSVSYKLFLDSLPNKIRDINISLSNDISVDRILLVRNIFDEIEKISVRIKEHNTKWINIDCDALDPFSVDEALRIAKDISQLFESANHNWGVIQKVINNTKINVEDYFYIYNIVLEVKNRNDVVYEELFYNLKNSGELRLINAFLDDCIKYREISSTIKTFHKVPFDRETAGLISDVIKHMGDLGLTKIDHVTIDSIEESCRRRLETFKALNDQVTLINDKMTSLNGFSFKRKMEILSLLSEFINDEVALLCKVPNVEVVVYQLDELKKKTYEYQSERESLERDFDLARIEDVEQLNDHLVTINNASILSVFSRSYWRAKRYYKSLSKKERFNRLQAKVDFGALSNLKLREQQISSKVKELEIDIIFGKNTSLDFEKLELATSTYKRLKGYLLRSTNDHIFSILSDWLENSTFFHSSIKELQLFEDERKIAFLEKNSCDLLSKINEKRKDLELFLEKFPELNGIEFKQLKTLSKNLNFLEEVEEKSSANEVLKSVLGQFYSGVETEKEDLIATINLVEELAGKNSHLDKVFFDIYKSSDYDLIVSQQKDLEVIISNIKNKIDSIYRITGKKDILGHPKDWGKKANIYYEMSKDKGGLLDAVSYISYKKKLGSADLCKLEIELFNCNSLKEYGRVFESLFYRALVREVYREHGDLLTSYDGQSLKQLRSEYVSLDTEYVKLMKDHLVFNLKVKASPPKGNNKGKVSEKTQLSLLEHELGKRKRRLSVRKLVHRADAALLELMPCWMMSPIAVSQYLKKKSNIFDLIIIDEASQMTPENAIGALLRGKQAMVVGDTNQLPPTSFFKKFISEDNDETEIEESILDMANIVFRPKKRLQWHYRSQDSSLINFSNKLIYQNDLVIFPSVSEYEQQKNITGVSLRKIDGFYSKGLNSIEAKSIVEEVANFMKTNSGLSLGVVTLNKKQRDLIQDEIEYLASNDRTIAEYIDLWEEKDEGLNKFFIKNLENVQGDERDVIYISTVYGPDPETNKVYQRFGPINGETGRRRLNVLFSRAKQKIVTFSSMTSSDINADENSNKGAWMLKKWLEYSASGILDVNEKPISDTDSIFEDYVIEQIESFGFIAIPQIGASGYFIDIGVKHVDWPYGFIMAVECDGASYHSTRFARERDRLREEILERMGWDIYRIWSTDWFNDPLKEGEKLKKALHERLDFLKKKTS